MAKNREHVKPVESESESESSEESQPGSETEKIRPLVSKPMEDPSNNGERKRRPKKLPAEDKETEGKKNPEPDNSKKMLFQRFWNEDDETVILEGMLDYKRQKKSDHVADLNSFHDSIKKNLQVDATTSQFKDKIRRLKKKYENNKSKDKSRFLKGHEQKVYLLSEKIWGSESVKDNKSRFLTAHEQKVYLLSEKIWGSGSVKENNGGIGIERGMDERIMATGEELFGKGKGVEQEQEWKKLKVEEIEVHLKQLDAYKAQVKLVLDALKSSTN